MTSPDMTPDKAAALRKPFPKEAIGKLPKGGTMLDYVGHAATTDRLLAVDPNWSWEPFALDPNTGLPALDSRGNLWIRLTVCGVTRIGVGDGKSAKEVIGDAIRNAAMRFGVALDLWSKEELEQSRGAVGALPALAAPAANAPAPTANQTKRMHALLTELGLGDRDKYLTLASWHTGRDLESTKDMTGPEVGAFITYLQDRKQQANAA